MRRACFFVLAIRFCPLGCLPQPFECIFKVPVLFLSLLITEASSFFYATCLLSNSSDRRSRLPQGMILDGRARCSSRRILPPLHSREIGFIHSPPPALSSPPTSYLPRILLTSVNYCVVTPAFFLFRVFKPTPP